MLEKVGQIPRRTRTRSDPREALRDLQISEYFECVYLQEHLQRLRMGCDWRHQSVELVAFIKSYMRACEKVGIPIYVEVIGDNDGFYVMHGHYHDWLTPEHWALIMAIGVDVSKTQDYFVIPARDGVPGHWTERD